MRQLIRAKPQEKEFPEESIAECLERINLQQMRDNGIVYRFGEVDRDNTTMMRQLDGNGANMGTGLGSAVLEYKQLPNTLLDNLPMDVKIRHIKRNGIESERNFIGQWNEDGHDLRFIFTIGQATTNGQRRVDIRSWHNSHLPEPAILNAVINSALLAIKRHIESPEPGSTLRQLDPYNCDAPMGIVPEKTSPLYDAWGNEIARKVFVSLNSFGEPMPDTHVVVQNDNDMMGSFLTHGAEPRRFGNKPMIPGVNIIRPDIRLAV